MEAPAGSAMRRQERDRPHPTRPDPPADSMLPNGLVVEYQTNYLNLPDIEAREHFYGSMLWIYRCEYSWERIHFGKRGFW
jgi:hypothetical protein